MYMYRNKIDSLEQEYNFQTGYVLCSNSSHSDYGDKYSEYLEDTTTYEDIDPNEA